ncbi:sigma 54-interacting transcriptional regulator [Lactiplantibacillus plantarum]|uniref:sigma 54-interacting transcriptional regulator n=1 Tax=Lactiplantibacillus plantarum TaxID=1590 RepID=UPI0018995189|nr:sigma 54-interacting transcriptional regulator [Lactiplantibacillus plantarum]
MKIKSQIYSLISERTKNSDMFIEKNNYTAESISLELKIQRNSASHYLNELASENKVIKVSGRPVLFFDKQSVENKYRVTLNNYYNSMRELNEMLVTPNRDAIFDHVIGSAGSLHSQIEQLKAAAYYPGNGLPIMFSGPTGVGKSYLAQEYFEFCKVQGLISMEGNFVQLNCAEYADNPELLSSILFGYTKGAFTGAEEDKSGLFDKANNGVLFLDEVHRLNAKGQERLFTYLDRGTITSLGEAGREKSVNVRLILATTEDIKSNFLQTFIRRIPVHIIIPSLLERPKSELEELIFSFYQSQAKKVDSPLLIKGSVYHALMNANYENNIGDLKNYITLSVANGLMSSIGQDKAFIDLNCLPVQVGVQELKHIVDPIEKEKDIQIDKDTDIGSLSGYQAIEKKVKQVLLTIIKLSNSEITSREELFRQINILTDTLLSDSVVSLETDEYLLIKKGIRIMLETLREQFHIDFLGNLGNELSKYLYIRHFYAVDKELEREINQNAVKKVLASSAFKKKLLSLALQILENTLNFKATKMDELVMGVYLGSAVLTDDSSTLRCVIIAHGQSTASSMAEVVNRLIGRSVVDSIDMPFDVSPTEIGNTLTRFVSERKFLQGVVLLVDMGSLTEIEEKISTNVDFPIGMATNVSTFVALEVAESIEKKLTLEQILERIKKDADIKTKLKYPTQIKRDIIITCCATGQGTAVKIKDLLESSFPASVDTKIFAYDEQQLENHSIKRMIKSSYNCLAVVGTIDPKLDAVPFFSLESLITESNLDQLITLLKPENVMDKRNLGVNLVRNFTVERVLGTLTILDARAVLRAIDRFIEKYEHVSGFTLNNQSRVALYVHISALVERLIRNEPMTSYTNISKLQASKAEELRQIKTAFSVIENLYSVKIPMTEIAYIFELLEKTRV